MKLLSTTIALVFALGALLTGAVTVGAYPLDGYEYTGISRLEGFRLAQEGKVRGRKLPVGGLLTLEEVEIRLTDRKDFEIPPENPTFQSQIRKLLGREANRYGVAVLDLTDIDNPRYAGHRDEARLNPGSVGKILVGLGLFQALAEAYPDDPQARHKILRTAQVTADEFILSDHHKIPLWEPGDSRIRYRPLQKGDTANLYTYLDWMFSASSNAAASMNQRELLLIKRFGKDYPLSETAIDAFFRDTPKGELSDLLTEALHRPVDRNGLDSDDLRQGGFFTWRGKQKVPGKNSYATPRALMNYLVKVEKGTLVDEFSSRELKRLLYMTQRRIRYASSPALRESAVYFKSGSLYKCREEAGFTCGKYMGNVYNILNSVAIVESPYHDPPLHYMVVIQSNVLRKNSAVVHQTLGTRIHRLIESFHRSGKSTE
jgi:hypothetical protein